MIITDADSIPQFWNQVQVPTDSNYDDLSEESRLALRQEMEEMNRIELKEKHWKQASAPNGVLMAAAAAKLIQASAFLTIC